MVGQICSFGFALIAFAFISTTWLVFAVMLALGIGNGYFAITLITLLQQRTPSAMMGRIMSLLMFSSMGLALILQALSGLIIKFSLEGLLIGPGALMIALAGWMVLDRDVRTLSETMLAPTAAD